MHTSGSSKFPSNLSPVFFSPDADTGYRHLHRGRGDGGERDGVRPPLHLQVQRGGQQPHHRHLELPVQSARQPVLQGAVRGETGAGGGEEGKGPVTRSKNAELGK